VPTPPSRTASSTGRWPGSGRTLRTARLTLAPVGAPDLPALMALKADPLVYGQMLGGVRSAFQTIEELAADRLYWATHGVGMFAIREGGRFQGTAGIHERPDGRGQALRFAVWPEARGRGLAREAAAAALRYAHDQAGLARVVAVAQAENFGSRMVLGSIGMRECDAFLRHGLIMLVYESVAVSRAPTA
jgi:RimJ/RimL family protein N-acetyltransferase